MKVVELKDITKRYQSKEALSGISLSVERGELLSLLGPSGSGKSTLLRIINLLEKPTSGEISLFGRSVKGLTQKERLEIRRRMALVTQKPVMFRGSVFENVAFSLRLRGMSRAEIKSRVKEALEVVGLNGFENRRARSLSGGEAQRVSFARALVFEPELLLLDEPTTSLDPINEAKIHEIIKKIQKKGITVILATHKQEEALALSRRIALLNSGRIEQIAGAGEIFRCPETVFCAEFTGMCNIFRGRVVEAKEDCSIVDIGEEIEVPFRASGEVCIGIRPEEVMVLREDVPLNPRHRNVLSGRILEITPKSSALTRILISTDRIKVYADLPNHVVEKMNLVHGKKVKFSLKFNSIRRLQS